MTATSSPVSLNINMIFRNISQARCVETVMTISTALLFDKTEIELVETPLSFSSCFIN